MGDTKICKICLAQGVRMFATEGCLDKYLKELLGHKMLNSSDIPPYICYECAYLLKKCIRFKQKCLLGQNVLSEILRGKNEITKEDILAVDRKRKKLVSSLMVTPVTEKHYFAFEFEEADSDAMDDGFNGEDDFLQPVMKEANVTGFTVDNFQEKSHIKDVEMHIKCVFCHKDLSSGWSHVVKKNVIQRIKAISLQLKDGLYNSLCSVNEIKIHGKCMKTYLEKTQREPLLSRPRRRPPSSIMKQLGTDLVQKNEDRPKSPKFDNSIDESSIEAMDLDHYEVERKETGLKPESSETYNAKIKFCVICHESLTNDKVLVKEQVLETLKEFSILRQDGLLHFFNSVDEVYVHDKCQNAYRTEGNYLKLIFPEGCTLSLEENYVLSAADQKCVICRGTRIGAQFRNIKEAAIEKLKLHSSQRNDGLYNFFDSVKELSVHENCRLKYTRLVQVGKYEPLKFTVPSKSMEKNKSVKHIKKPKRYTEGRATKTSKPSKKFLIASEAVDYEKCCFICTKVLKYRYEIKLNPAQRRETKRITKIGSKEEIIRNLQMIKNSPEYSEYINVHEAIERINSLDLIAIGAQYHLNCYNDVISPRKDKKVQPHVQEAMNSIFNYIEEMGEDAEFTLQELASMLTCDYIPSRKSIKNYLRKRYNDRVTFTRNHKDVIVMFKN